MGFTPTLGPFSCHPLFCRKCCSPSEGPRRLDPSYACCPSLPCSVLPDLSASPTKMGTMVKPNVRPHCVILAACLNVGRFEKTARRKWVQVLSQPPWGPACRWHLLIGSFFAQESPACPGVLRILGQALVFRPGTALEGRPRTAISSAKNR